MEVFTFRDYMLYQKIYGDEKEKLSKYSIADIEKMSIEELKNLYVHMMEEKNNK